MSAARPQVVFFNSIDKNDIPLVGGKGANLGEMVKAGFPVPPGFAVTVEAYDQFLQENNLSERITDLLKNLDTKDPTTLNNTANKIQQLIKTASIPHQTQAAINKAYRQLSGRFKLALVAARSSATAEDLPSASFAGQQATYLNLRGNANLLESVRLCWASLFTPRAIFYRTENKINHSLVKISVIVQKMIQSEVSGVIFTLNPVTNDKNQIIIEAVWGLGEMIVQGSVVPDRYLVQKGTLSILSKEISDQSKYLTRKGDKTQERPVPVKYTGIQKITDEEIIKLAGIAQRLHQHYYFPQDIEWSREKSKLYILQTRPVTTISATTKAKSEQQGDNLNLTPILSGIPASPGCGKGIAKVLKDASEIGKINAGDVLVAPMTSPDYVPAMKKAEAIVTDQGGQTSHAAIVSRELGIPCIVGTKEATKVLNNHQLVTVDGTKGQVYLGTSVTIVQKPDHEYRQNLKTATKIYVNLAEPEKARAVAKLNVDGVGLLRAEFMMAGIGLHPKEAIKLKQQDAYVQKLSQSIKVFCEAFYPRPVVYRASDFKTNEYRMLKGGKNWEPLESNPMLGFRGAYRYLSTPEVFTLELRALKVVQKRFTNIRLMIPFVRTPEELAKIRRMTAAEGLFEHPEFKFWMMVELPVNVICLDDFIAVGIDGVSIGSNDLTMLISGTDRDNAEVARVFDERSKAVLWALAKTIKTCSHHHITSSICGQAPSIYDDYTAKLIQYGVTSISVNPDAIDRVRNLAFEAEKNIDHD